MRILRRLARRPYLKDVVNKHGRYFVYPDLTVFYVPKRAIDPFHSFNETPGKIVRAMRSHSLILEDLTRQDKNHVFLTFQKRER